MTGRFEDRPPRPAAPRPPAPPRQGMPQPPAPPRGPSAGSAAGAPWPAQGDAGTTAGGDALGQMKEQGQQTVMSIAGQARQQATSRLHEQKERASGGLDTMAQALRQTGQQLREQDQGAVAQYTDQTAQQIERLAAYLQQRDVSQLAGEVEGFARRRPALFLGAAFGLGFLGVRFLKSSASGGQAAGGAGDAPLSTSIEVDVPVRTAYNQWTQFEEFPRFMEGIEEVRQFDDKRLHWRAQIAGKTAEWDAVITEQTPDRRIAWRNTTGARNAGVVSFQPSGPNRTRVSLRLDYEPQGVVEQVGSAMGIVNQRIKGDLRRFKEFIESRGAETGAWRGEIQGERVQEHGGRL